jgi:hypothetical protein
MDDATVAMWIQRKPAATEKDNRRRVSDNFLDLQPGHGPAFRDSIGGVSLRLVGGIVLITSC